MTLQQYVESISRQFPDKGQTEIAVDLNNGLKDFCEKTKILHGMWVFTVTSGVVSGTDETRPTADALTIVQPVASNGYFAVALPTNIVSFGTIRVYDTSGANIQSDVSYDITEEHLRVFGAIPTVGVSENASYASIKTIELSVSRYPLTVSALGDIPEIPVEYHRGIESYILALYYRRNPVIATSSQGSQYAVNINMARELEQEYQSYVVRGKKQYFLNHQMGQTVADGWNY